MSPSADGYCPCGRRLHYSHPVIKEEIERLVARHGEFVTVRVGDRAWRVSRHYIALHGLKAWELPTLGFEEITP